MQDQDTSSQAMGDQDDPNAGTTPPQDDTQAAGASDPQTEAGGTPTPADPAASPLAGEENLVIPDEVRANFPDLVELIKNTESMNDEERNYWFQTLLIMTDEQVQNLRQILNTEKENLAAIDQKAQEEINEVNQRQMQEWKEFEQTEKRKIIKQAEKQSREEDKGEQEALLDELENL